jgi:hypothetical protein
LSRKVVENDEFGAFTRRIVRAYARRVATGDIEALDPLVRRATAVEDSIKTRHRPAQPWLLMDRDWYPTRDRSAGRPAEVGECPRMT